MFIELLKPGDNENVFWGPFYCIVRMLIGSCRNHERGRKQEENCGTTVHAAVYYNRKGVG